MSESTQDTGQRPVGERRHRKVGVVTSSGMNKTVVVSVGRLVAHARYGKRQRRTSTFQAHDETNQCHVGDHVEIEETRPVSKRKRWRVTKIVRRGASGVPASTGRGAEGTA